jgi:hypothetical protein
MPNLEEAAMDQEEDEEDMALRLEALMVQAP